jgi:hypothetical protein
MKNCLIVSLFFLFISGFVYASDAEIQPPDNLAGQWLLSDQVMTYNGQNLYGHINGGAELFLEFGFDQLSVFEYQYQQYQIELEIYKMKSERAALGIYLAKSGQMAKDSRIDAENIMTPYQIMLTKGKYFIQINNFSGQSAHSEIMIDLANRISRRIKGNTPKNIFTNLPHENLIRNSQRLFCGPYSLQSIYTFGEDDILQLQGKIFGIAADYQGSSGETHTMLFVDYGETSLARTAYNHIITHLDPYLSIIKRTAGYFIFSDYQKKYGIVEIDGATLSIKIHLSSAPEI